MYLSFFNLGICFSHIVMLGIFAFSIRNQHRSSYYLFGLSIAMGAQLLVPIFRYYNIPLAINILAILAFGIPSLFLMTIQSSLEDTDKYFRISQMIALLTYISTIAMYKTISLHPENQMWEFLPLILFAIPVTWSVWIIGSDCKTTLFEPNLPVRTTIQCLSLFGIVAFQIIGEFNFLQSETNNSMLLVNSTINVVLIFFLKFSFSNYDFLQVFTRPKNSQKESLKKI